MMQGRCRSVRTSQVPAVCGTGYTELDFERSRGAQRWISPQNAEGGLSHEMSTLGGRA